MNEEEKKAASAIMKRLELAETDEQMSRLAAAYCALTQGVLNRAAADKEA